MTQRKPRNQSETTTIAKPKNLTLSDLNKYASKLDGKKTVYILDGKHSVSISKTFKETELQKLAIEYLQYINELKQRSDVTPDTMLSVGNLIYALVCKHFTNLPIQVNTLDELVGTTQNLLNLGIITQLFSGDPDEGFDEEQTNKLSETLNKVAENVGKVVGELAIAESLNTLQTQENASEDSKVDESNGE